MLLKEMQSLGLDMRVLKDDNTEVEILEGTDYDGATDLRAVIEGDRYSTKDETESFKKRGFTEQEVVDDELVNVEEEYDPDEEEFADDYEESFETADEY